MSTDLTGTPTPLGIGKYNVDADAPSGLGFNAAMDQIDALLGARVNKPAGLQTNDVPVWNGTTFVRPSGTPSAAVFLRGDGAWTADSGHELAYAENDTNTTLNSLTQAGANTIVTFPSVTFDGSTKIKIEWAAQRIDRSSTWVQIALFEDGVARAVFGIYSATVQAASSFLEFTPSSAAHTYSIRGYVDAGTATVYGGSGTAGAPMPFTARITKAS